MNNTRKIIKKIVSLSLLVVMIMVSFVACLEVKQNDKDKNVNDIGKEDKGDINQDNNNSNDISKNNDNIDEQSNEPVSSEPDKPVANIPDATKPDNSNSNGGDMEKAVETFLDENNIVTNSDSIEVVVNKERALSKDYVPKDLVKLTDVPTLLAMQEVNQLRKPAADALTKLIEAAKEEINIQLYARSGYRSYKTQESTYDGYVKNHGQEAADKFSARAGHSEHQTGLAIDISSESVNYLLEEEFGETLEGKWVAENAHRFGFIIRYPKGKEDITGYQYEPWHLRYLGEDLATKVYESGLTLEQYFFDSANE